jgi:mannose-6-phosphate isomerase-like protein (cupin superfamily)
VSDSNGPFDLSKTPIHLGSQVDADNPAVPLAGFGFDGPSFEAYIGEHCAPGAPGRLIMVETTPVDWTTWERHTEGDEIVVVLEGRGEFVQQIDGGEQRMPVGPGSALINPTGVWHSADVTEPIKAIYITPCPGTEHKERKRD